MRPKSTLNCRVERTLDATTLVDFVSGRVDLRYATRVVDFEYFKLSIKPETRG
jgi:hypothetical protein